MLQHLQFLSVVKLATRDRITLREREEALINRNGMLSNCCIYEPRESSLVPEELLTTQFLQKR